VEDETSAFLTPRSGLRSVFLSDPDPSTQWNQVEYVSYTVKKGLGFSHFQPGCHQPNSPWSGKIKLFPARESLVSDIPAGDGKIKKNFLQCTRSGSTILAKEAVQMGLSPAASLQPTVRIKIRP
jgi:hypothetical protein